MRIKMVGSTDYIVGDSRHLGKLVRGRLASLPTLIITSPPYFDLKDYGVKNQIGFGQDYRHYLIDIRKVLDDCYKVSSQNASLWLIVDSFKTSTTETVALPFDIAGTLKQGKTWELRDVIIWNKMKNVPWYGKGHLKNHFEYILLFTKHRKFQFNIDEIREIADLKKWWLTYPERYSPKGMSPSNVWEFTTQIRGWGSYGFSHMCPFPFALVERIVTLASTKGDTVMDPFAGSGAVMAMAAELDRNAIGVDINEDFRNTFEITVADAKRYWAARSEELDLLSRKISDFRILNGRLRKLKVASKAVESMLGETASDHSDIAAVCLGADDKKNEISLLFIGAKTPELSERKTPYLTALIKQSKIALTTSAIDKADARQRLAGKDLYLYKTSKPYQVIATIKINEIEKGILGKECFLSDVEVKVNKPDDILAKDIRSLVPGSRKD